MNKNIILRFHVISTIFVMTLGVLLHFTYDWSSQNIIVGFFSAINESTWEHLKLIFFPMFISSVIGFLVLGKSITNYWCARLKGIVSAMVFTVVFFYTYIGVLGYNIGIINILTFFVAVLIGEFISCSFMVLNKSCNNIYSVIVLILLFTLFILFTYRNPDIGLFRESNYISLIIGQNGTCKEL